ncbi:hypothetical protein QQ008_10555 [Fulvivirgaceae bacterium BMA10]|uniref:Peptidase E n=1 Tax=Splendidivirga corallicola TaxID=3051826 RepID=A0ABT8KMY2_9BACT|nr:hypothetical protein [Fulvivirgaceae bacterium BMA10]
MQQYLICAVFFFGSMAIHPFHVSVCEIEFDQKTAALQITQRIFLDDIELGLRKTFGKDFDIMDDQIKQEVEDMLEKYLQEHLVLKVNDQPVDINYLGHEMDREAIWCYLEVQNIKAVQKVEVENTILFEEFDDQANLVHVEFNDNIKSFKLTPEKRIDSVEF